MDKEDAVCVCTYTQIFSVTQSWPALRDPMDCSPPGSSVRGISQARILEWGAVPFSGIFSTQGWSLCLLNLLHWQADSLPQSHLASPRVLMKGKKFFSISLILYL